MANSLVSVELCAGAGGQALGLEQAGFDHAALVEIDSHACQTLRLNRPNWRVVEGDLKSFSDPGLQGIDLLAGGVPCPPFSKAGKQLGGGDERDLFPEALRLVDECRPRAVLLENVRGLLDPVFADYRNDIGDRLSKLGYTSGWRLHHASQFGVPQLRPRVALVAIRRDLAENFSWPVPHEGVPPTVGESLFDLMAARGWPGASAWKYRANSIAPTLVGGSKKHGGPDLGPTRARRAWAALGVNGCLLAYEAPGPEFDPEGMPHLTVRMVARIQGFPDTWEIAGKKTAAYRQVGNAFPPPVACAIAKQIAQCLASSGRAVAVRKPAWHATERPHQHQLFTL